MKWRDLLAAAAMCAAVFITFDLIAAFSRDAAFALAGFLAGVSVKVVIKQAIAVREGEDG